MCDDLENMLRCNNIRIYHVAECVEINDMMSFVMELVTKLRDRQINTSFKFLIEFLLCIEINKTVPHVSLFQFL